MGKDQLSPMICQSVLCLLRAFRALPECWRHLAIYTRLVGFSPSRSCSALDRGNAPGGVLLGILGGGVPPGSPNHVIFHTRFFNKSLDGELPFVGRRRNREKKKKSFSRGSLFKTWPKPETAHEKPLAPRVQVKLFFVDKKKNLKFSDSNIWWREESDKC